MNFLLPVKSLVCKKTIELNPLKPKGLQTQQIRLIKLFDHSGWRCTILEVTCIITLFCTDELQVTTELDSCSFHSFFNFMVSELLFNEDSTYLYS